MSDKEHKAMAWLDGVASDRITHLRVVDGEYARTLKTMLSRPVLPEEPSEEALKAIWNGERTPGPIYRRLYAHLTAPETMEIEVWHVEFFDQEPCVNVWTNREAADANAESYRATNHIGVRVTGPHTQQVPT